MDWSCCCVRQQLHRLRDRIAHVAVWLYPCESVLHLHKRIQCSGMVKGAENSIRIDHRRSSKMVGGAWAGALQKGAYVEVEGELRYREFSPAESDRSVRLAEIYATSVLALDRSEKQPTPEAV